MKSIIVSKFYSKLEKLGLKKHQCSNDEIKYLESLNEIEQCEVFNDESDFIINRLNFKLISSIFVAVLFILLSFLFLLQDNILLSIIFLIFGVICFFYTKIIKIKIDIQSLLKKIFNDAKSNIIQNIYK